MRALRMIMRQTRPRRGFQTLHRRSQLHQQSQRYLSSGFRPNGADQRPDKETLLVEKIVAMQLAQDRLTGAEFIEVCETAGIDSSEAPRYSRLLEERGIALQVSSVQRDDCIIYLRPAELVEKINVLIDPDGVNGPYRELCRRRALKELEVMEEKKDAIERGARFNSRVKLWSSFAIVTGYVCGTGYLTGFVFSWDTMEPLTYFFGGFVNVVMLAYAGFRAEEFDFQAQYERWKLGRESTLSKQQQFDFDRYELLKEYISRLD